jgi:hypothetical protein
MGLALLGTAAALAPGASRADVTIEQQSTFDFAIVKAHGNTTELTTADKRRSDSDLHCEGFMSLFCGNAQSADIIRLDRGLTWTLEPKKKQYRETPFPTEAERQAAVRQAQEMMEKIKQCPAVQQHSAPAPDTSKCEMSPPRVEVKQPGTHAMFAGHDTQLTQLAMTRSCTNKETGDVCDFAFVMDAWLTQDQIPGLDEHQAFETAYRTKLGLNDERTVLVAQKQLRQFLAPYADSLKQLAGKAEDFKGYPLKTSMRIAFGGPHCAAAKNAGSGGAGSAGSGSGGTNVVGDASQAAGNAAASSAAGAAGSAAGAAAANAAGNSAASSVVGSAASAFGSKLVSGLFNKKKTDSTAATPAAASATAPTATTTGLAPGMVQAAEITIETTSISTGPVAPAQFDVPAGWKLIVPEAKAPKEFTCPTSGS